MAGAGYPAAMYESLQLTTVVVALHRRDMTPTDEGTLELRLVPSAEGISYELRMIGADPTEPVQLTNEELDALPAARAALLDQFTTQS